ncbi:hypothetical protein [Elongatibacter sediminis]|uniref:Uncharacterized protein n=1 Tax=Elongatibacter sediminis TaxID=3119006 RepID=A0AAW9R8X1_9GAMM
MDSDRTERINEDLKARTGIDFSRYRDPRLSAAIGNAVTFPLYLGRSLSRPVGLLLLLIVLLFFLTDNAFFRTLLVFPGSLLVIVNGVLLGLVLFIQRMGGDMKQVFDISTDLCVQALRDVSTARMRLRDRDAFPGTLEIFQGVNTIVILPIVIETLERKIPFLGRLAGKLTERFFRLADARLAARIARAAPEAPGTGAPAEPAQAAAWLDAAERGIQSVQAAIGKAVNGVTRVVAFPFVAVLAVVAFVSIGLLYGGWVLTG